VFRQIACRDILSDRIGRPRSSVHPDLQTWFGLADFAWPVRPDY
jgi:hypothetical protein